MNSYNYCRTKNTREKYFKHDDGVERVEGVMVVPK